MSIYRLDSQLGEQARSTAAQETDEYWLAALPFPDGLYLVQPQQASGRAQPADYAAALSAGLWGLAITLVLALLITLV